MYNLQPGQGLGTIASKEIAFGLGLWGVGVTILREIVERVSAIVRQLELDSKIGE